MTALACDETATAEEIVDVDPEDLTTGPSAAEPPRELSDEPEDLTVQDKQMSGKLALLIN